MALLLLLLLLDIIVVAVLGCISVFCITGCCLILSLLDFVVGIECLLLNDMRTAVLIVKSGHACGAGGARHSLIFANRHTVIF